MVQTTDQIPIATTTHTGIASAPEVIRNEPVVKLIQEAPVVENIIEKKNIEIHNRNIIKEVHEQQIIEVERRPETKYVEEQSVENRVVAPTKYEEIGERTMPNLPVHQQNMVTPSVETNVTERQLSPIIERIIERPVYKQVIIEQHEIPVQTVYTTVPVIHPVPQQQTFVENTAILQQTTRTTELNTVQTLQHQQNNIPRDNLRLIRSGYGKAVWGLSHGGELFRMSRQAKLGMMWERFNFWEGSAGLRFQDFSVVKNGLMWLIGQDDRQLYFLDPRTRHEGMIRPMFQNMTGIPRLRSVSAYDNTHAYLLAEDGSIHLYDNGRLLRINGQLKALSSGNPHRRLFGKHFELWGIGMDNQAKRWNGVDAWLDVGVLVRDVAVGVDNSVYAIDANGLLLKWVHNSNVFEACRTKFDENTTMTPSQFTGVTVFKEHRGVYCVDGMGNVFSMDV